MSLINKPQSIHALFMKLARNYTFNLEEDDVIDWAGDAIEHMGIGALKPDEKVVFLEVNNFHVDLPQYVHQIVQIAKDNGSIIAPDKIVSPIPSNEVQSDSNTNTDACSCQVVNEVKIHSIDCHNQAVPIDKEGRPLEAYDVAYYRPFYDLHYLHNSWFNSTTYHNRYTPVRLSNHTFFNSIVCEENESLMSNCMGDEYTIIAGDLLRFNFKQGRIALSCLMHPLDEQGWPKVEGGISAMEAIEWYCVWKICTKLYYDGQDGYERKMDRAEKNWHHYCQQAGSNNMMIAGIDEWENFTAQNIQTIPKLHKYNNFFGTLNRRERKLYNMTNKVKTGFHYYGR